MRRAMFKISIWLIILPLTIVGIVAVQPVHATGVGEEEVQNLYKNQGYKYFPKLPNVSVDKFFTIKFSKPIDYETVNNNSIQLIEKQTGEKVSLVFEQMDGGKVRAIPQQPLIKGETYYLIVHKTVKTKNGGSNLSQGIITEVSVSDKYSSFMVESVNLISANKIEVRFNEIVKYSDANIREHYRINNINPLRVDVLGDGKTVILTSKTSFYSYSYDKDITIFVSNNICNSLDQPLVYNYNEKIRVLNNTFQGSNYGGKANDVKKLEGLTVLKGNINIWYAEIAKDLYINEPNVNLNNVDVKGTIYIDVGSRGRVSLDNVTAPRIKIVSAEVDNGIVIKNSKLGILDASTWYDVDKYNNNRIERDLIEPQRPGQPTPPIPPVVPPVQPTWASFNAMPPEIYGKTKDGVQSFDILVQVIGATFKEDLDGINYDRYVGPYSREAVRLVTVPTGFGIGTLPDGSPDVTAIERVSPHMLRIRIDGRFPLLQDDRLILELSESVLNETEKNIYLVNRTIRVRMISIN